MGRASQLRVQAPGARAPGSSFSRPLPVSPGPLSPSPTCPASQEGLVGVRAGGTGRCPAPPSAPGSPPQPRAQDQMAQWTAPCPRSGPRPSPPCRSPAWASRTRGTSPMSVGENAGRAATPLQGRIIVQGRPAGARGPARPGPERRPWSCRAHGTRYRGLAKPPLLGRGAKCRLS